MARTSSDRFGLPFAFHYFCRKINWPDRRLLPPPAKRSDRTREHPRRTSFATACHADQQGTIRMQLRASFATAERLAPGVRLHRPQQRRQVVDGQYAHRSQRPGQSFRHPGQDTAYQPFPHQRQLVSGRSARLRLRPHIENPTRRVRQNHHRYVLRCERMHFLFVLVDSRLEPQKIDLRFIEMLGREGIPFGIVFTKTTNCRPHSSHAASNATNKCSVNSGRSCLRCSAPRAKNGRAAKRSWTSSANV